MKRIFILTAVCLFAFIFGGCSQKQDVKPNIIFFIADDMYPEMFNCLPQGQGKNLTPAMDKLAAEGVIFEINMLYLRYVLPAGITV